MSIDFSHPWQGHGSLFWTAVIGFPAVAFMLCWGLYEGVIRYAHYSLGALITFLLLPGAGGLVSGAFERRVLPELKTEPKEERKVIEAKLKVVEFVVNISVSATAVLILITVFAWVSYALVQLGFGGPEIGSAATYTSLIKTYGWHLVDLVPFMNVQKSLGLQNPPVEFQGWTMGAPVLVFRVLVGVVAFTAIKKAWTRFAPGDATGDSRTGTGV